MVRRRRSVAPGRDAGAQTAGVPAPAQRRLGNVDRVCWLQPSSVRNRWHLGPACRGFDGRHDRITGHLACRICAFGLATSVRNSPRPAEAYANESTDWSEIDDPEAFHQDD